MILISFSARNESLVVADVKRGNKKVFKIFVSFFQLHNDK